MNEPALSAMLPPAICLMGPTASGKTDLAVRLVEQLPLEIVSVDSAMVYRDMNVGTAKPDTATLARAPHRLIDLIAPTEAYSAGRFRDDALREMADIHSRGRIPLLVGGTMLYFKALKGGIDVLPAANPALRAEIEARAQREGWPALHAELAHLDPLTAARLAPNDSQRIERALEVYLSSGRPLSAWHGRTQQATLPYRLLELALVPSDRDWLRQRINLRFAQMLELGLVEEVVGLRAHYALTADLPSMRCVGYRQAWHFLEQGGGGGKPDALLATGCAATRQLAKRQLTWLRAWAGAEIIDPLSMGCFEQIRARIDAFLAVAS